ncbi:MAG TPA: nucleotide sugar dehydrogenase, partial [Microscillaceae bacterium]|nr:nucleotide sugar dehydrogenase [Microscillaceae bacterium]
MVSILPFVEDLKTKKTKIAVVGLGYVGLPIALAFARKSSVIGFDVNAHKVKQLTQHFDETGEVETSQFAGCDIHFTDKITDLRQATFFIIAVPTPIDQSSSPDLSYLIAASKIVGQALKAGDYVVYESTVYPGCTEEDCIPVLEQVSGLQYRVDFQVGYSPERINPGDPDHKFEQIVKVVSGGSPEATQIISQVYQLVVEAGVFEAASIKVAEAAKVIENTQRDLNIALMNELSLIFDKMGINTYEVLEAARTKWNFLPFVPGLVGGHCIGVDPYYLTHKARTLGYQPKVILSGRDINDSMGAYIAKRLVQLMLQQKNLASNLKVLILGFTFKENVRDIRNSKVADIVRELHSFHIETDIVDMLAHPEEVEKEYGYHLAQQPADQYDAVLLAVPHTHSLNLSAYFFISISKLIAVFAHFKG